MKYLKFVHLDPLNCLNQSGANLVGVAQILKKIAPLAFWLASHQDPAGLHPSLESLDMWLSKTRLTFSGSLMVFDLWA